MPPRDEALSPELYFKPHWFADPPPWWINEVFDEGQRVAVATIQLKLVKDTLAVQLAAVEGLQKVMGQKG